MRDLLPHERLQATSALQQVAPSPHCSWDAGTRARGKATALWLYPELSNGHFAPEVVGRKDRSAPAVIMRQVPTPDIRTTSIGNAQLALTSPALTVPDMARWHGVAHSVNCGEILVARGLATQEEIAELANLRRFAHGSQQAIETVGLINGLSESFREAEVKNALTRQGFTVWYQQAAVLTAQGRQIARVDFLFPHQSVVLEYDGKGKTRGQFGTESDTSVADERERERILVREGLRVVRVTVATFHTDEWVDQRTRALKENERREFPTHQWREARP